MKKRILSTILALCMCLSLLPAAAFATGGSRGYYIGKAGESTSFPSNAIAAVDEFADNGFYFYPSQDFSGIVSVGSNVSLVLMDGCDDATLYLTGTADSSSLDIYAGVTSKESPEIKGTGTCAIGSISGVTVTLYGGTYTSLPESGWKLGDNFRFYWRVEDENADGGYIDTYSHTFPTDVSSATVVHYSDDDAAWNEWHSYTAVPGTCDYCGHVCDHVSPPVTGTRSLDLESGQCSYCHWQYPVRYDKYGSEGTDPGWMTGENFEFGDVNLNGATVTLYSDISGFNFYNAGASEYDCTVDLKGHTLTQATGSFTNFDVTIKDSVGTGTIKGLFEIRGGSVQLHAGVTLADGIKTTVTGATLADYLAPGTAYEQGGEVVNAYDKQALSGTVKIVTHTHDFSGGTICASCGAPDTGCKTEGCTGSYNDKGFCSVNDSHYQPATQKDGVYEISNAGQLYWFAAQVNSGSNTINAKLMDNIEINDSVLKTDGTLNTANSANFRQWTPIGNNSSKSNRYCGTFDGNNKTISGLYYSGSDEYVGLFGYVGKRYDENIKADVYGTVQNVTLTDSYLYSENSSSSISVGGIAGEHSKGTITHCTVNATVRGKNTSNDKSTYIGGIAGLSSGSISFCANLGTISGECTQRHAFVGGIVGYKSDPDTAVTNCYNTGDISGNTPNSNRTSIGGVVGSNDNGSTINCYNVGTVSSTKEDANIGGVAGSIPYGSISNCYYQKAASDTISGIGSKSSDVTANAESKTAAEFASGEVAWLLNGKTATPETGNTLAWYQKLGTGGDASPTLDSSRGTVYHGYPTNSCQTAYSNDDITGNTPTHKWSSDGKCKNTGCTATCEHKNVGTDNKCTACTMQMKVYAKDDEENSAYFPSLGAALGAVSPSKGFYVVIRLLADCEENIEHGRGLSLDLNGHKLTSLELDNKDIYDMTITDGSNDGAGAITTLKLTGTSGSVKLSGGSYGTIENAKWVKLPDGYALRHTGENESGTDFVKRSEITGTLNNVKVVKCTAHGAVTGDNKCGYCNTAMVAKVTYTESGTEQERGRYATFNEAYTAAQSGDTLTLLANATFESADDSSPAIGKNITLDLNGKTLTGKTTSKSNDDIFITGTVTVQGTGTINNLTIQGKNANATLKGNVTLTNLSVIGGGKLTVENAANVLFLIVGDHSGNGTLTMSGGFASSLIVYPGSTVTLTGGTFDNIACGNIAVGSLLAEGYAFKTTSGDTPTWYDKNNSDATSLSNVTVTAAPVKSVSITTTDNKTSYTYGETVGVTATITLPGTTHSEEVDYKFYLDDKVHGSNTMNPNASLTTTITCDSLSVGKHTFYIEVTVGGYTLKSSTLTVNVSKATLTENESGYTAPAKKTLTFNGKYQELIEKGSFADSISGAKFYYGTKDESGKINWSEGVPSTGFAGTYTVYWYIDGGENYESVGSAENPMRIDVTIAQKPVTPSIVFDNNNQTSYTYTGSEIKPAFTLKDGNTVIPESEYTVSYSGNTNVCKNAQVTVTCTNGGNYNFVAVTRTFEITKAAAPSLTNYAVSQCYTDGNDQRITIDLTKYGFPAGETITGTGVEPDDFTKLDGVSIGVNSTTFEGTTLNVNYYIRNAGSGNVNNTVTFPIKIKTQNYENMTLNVVVTLTKKENKTLTVSMADWTYGDTAGTLSVSGLPDGVTATVTYTGRNDTTYNSTKCPTNAGDYSVSVRYESETAIYSGTADFTIAKRTVTVGPKSYTITRGDAIPAFELEWSGVVEGDTLGLSITEASFSCYDGLTEVGTSTAAGSYNINWLNAENADLTGDDAVNYTLTKLPTGMLTINAKPSSGSSGTTITVPVSSDHASVDVKATVSRGNATVAVSDKQIEQVIADHAGEVTIDVSGLKNVESATVPSHVVEKTNEAENTGLTVALPAGSVALDETALENVSENAGGKDVTVSVVSVPTDKLPQAVKDIIGMEPTVAAVVDVNITVNGKKQSTFNGGKITVSIPYTPKAGEDTSKLTVWFIKDDGTIENKGGYYDTESGCFVFETEHLSQYLLVNPNEIATFTDVSANAYYAAAVNWAVKNEITGGVGNDKFAPDLTCTRGQIVTFLWRAAGKPAVDYAMNFTDVGESAYYTEAVRWAASLGIVGGYGNGKFGPDDVVTREQVATILYRFAASQSMDTTQGGMLVREFEDYERISNFAVSAMQWAVNAGIMQGNNGKLMPQDSCDRAQIVTMLYRLLGK